MVFQYRQTRNEHGVFLDLKKSLDTVDTSYLTDRTVLSNKSSLKMVQCGIPYGSCLGPLLFILYVNDFEQCLKKCTSNMYADVDNIAKWSRQNKLSLNTDHQNTWLLVTSINYRIAVSIYRYSTKGGKYGWRTNQTGPKH